MLATDVAAPVHRINNLEPNIQATASDMDELALRHYHHRQKIFGNFLMDLTVAALQQARTCRALR
jgi:hypothetical protein